MATRKKRRILGKEALIGAGLAIAGAAGYFLGKAESGNRGGTFDRLVGMVGKKAAAAYRIAKEGGKRRYERAATEILRDYRGLKNIDAKEFKKLGRELKKHWSRIEAKVAEGRRAGKK